MRKSNFRKATLSALLMLVVAVVSLTGVTYAWFTSGTQAKVENINIGVTGAAGGLQIALDNDQFAFGSSIDFADTNNGVTYAPVSTSLTALKEGKFFTAEIGSTAQKIKNIKAATANTHYFAQSILIDNYGGDAKTIELTGSATCADKETELAIRIAIVIDGVNKAPTYTAEDKNKYSAEENKQVYIYEPNATSHTNAGKNEAKLDGLAQPEGNQKYKYFGIVKALATGEGAPTEISKYSADDGYLEEVTTYGMDTASTDKPQISIQAGAVVKATIYVWVEGQDHDCHNDIASGVVTANLSLDIKTGGVQPTPGA